MWGPRADLCEKLQGDIRLEGEYTCTWRVNAHVGAQGWSEEGVCLGVSAQEGGCLPRRGVSTQGGVYLGVSAWGCLPRGCVSQHALRQTLPPPTVNRMTDR